MSPKPLWLKVITTLYTTRYISKIDFFFAFENYMHHKYDDEIPLADFFAI